MAARIYFTQLDLQHSGPITNLKFYFNNRTLINIKSPIPCIVIQYWQSDGMAEYICIYANSDMEIILHGRICVLDHYIPQILS